MQSMQIRKTRLLGACIALLTLVLVGLGGFVRATGAGLSCPDWPLCWGKLVPEMTAGVAQEVIHRYLALGVGLLTLSFVVQAYRFRFQSPRLFKVSLFALCLLVIQAVFGGLTVTMKLNPFVVTAHLILGTLFFQTIALIITERVTPRKKYVDPRETSKPFSRLLFLTCIATFSQIALGGFVGSSGASLACPDFPLCFGKFAPDPSMTGGTMGAMHTHMSHRFLGILVAIMSVCLVAISKHSGEYPKTRRGHLFGVTFLVFVQIGLGIFNIYWLIPISGTVAHLVIAQLILLGQLALYRDLKTQLRVFPSQSIIAGDEMRYAADSMRTFSDKVVANLK